MAAALAEACGSSRCVFVVGKGGVGKTTTAGALAVLFARGGSGVRLLSTDPAHSLGDLFGEPLPPGGTARVCGGVQLEEFDAAAYAATWSASVRPALAEILEAGTYLDAGEVAGFLDLSLPGIDEVMAAFRLAELAEVEVERLVVDTAPTGHTLRLLEAGDAIDGWLVPLRAMAAKAATVASGLTGSPVRLTAESALDEMATAAGTFRRLLADATFLVVERAGEAVRAETDRLLEWLGSRRLRVGAVLHVGPGPVRAHSRVIRLPPPGPQADRCEALAELGIRAQTSDAGAPSEPVVAHAPARGQGDARAFLRSLRPRILLFAGKGGVGKSTCAAAAALALAESRSVLLVSTDPAGSLTDVLGRPVGGEPTRIGPRLTARQIEAQALLAAAGERHRDEIRRIFERVGLAGDAMDRAILESFPELAPPGADEVMALAELTGVDEAGEVVVVDAAPTGHFLRLLEMPELVGGWTRALLRVLARYRTAVGLDDITEKVLEFAKELRTLRENLTDPEVTGAFVVTLDAPLVVEETARLQQALAASGVGVIARIVNRVRSADASGRPVGGDVPVFAAPERARSPVGEAELTAFLDSWKRIA